MEGAVDVARDGDVHSALVVVPVDGEAAIA